MLAIDTSTSAIGVAVVVGDADPVVGVEVDARAHSEKLAPLVRDTLAAAGVAPGDLTDVAVGTGPGPFTGLRVGMVTAVTMGHVLGIPVHGVCSLDALAEQALAGSAVPELLVATDARRKEVYWARYGRGADPSEGAVALTPPAVDRPAELAADAARPADGGPRAGAVPRPLPGRPRRTARRRPRLARPRRRASGRRR